MFKLDMLSCMVLFVWNHKTMVHLTGGVQNRSHPTLGSAVGDSKANIYHLKTLKLSTASTFD